MDSYSFGAVRESISSAGGGRSPPSARVTARALVAAAAVLLGAALLFGGGSGDGRVAWIGGAALTLPGAVRGGALGEAATSGDGREGAAFALLAAGFLVWTGITILWSILPDRSWDYFNRGLTYLVFAVLGAFVGSLVAPGSSPGSSAGSLR